MDINSVNQLFNNLERAAAAIRTHRRRNDLGEFQADSRRIHVQLFAAIPLTMLLGGIVAWMGLASALQIATLGGMAFIGYRYWNARPVSIKSVVLFVVGVFAVYMAAAILSHRLLASALLAITTVIVFERKGRDPLNFYREYLYADSVYTNEQRSKLPHLRVGPDRLTMLLCLAVIVFVPWLHSTSFAILILCLLCPAIIFWHVARDGNPMQDFRFAIRTAQTMLREYLTYPDVASPTRSWPAQRSCGQRRDTFSILWIMLAVVLMVSLSYCIPWEFFASYFQPGFHWNVPPAPMSGYTWLMAPLAMAISASGDYRWALGIGAVLSFVLPYVMLFTFYLPGILQMHRAMTMVEDLRKQDPRTEYERRVDRTLDSEVLEN